MENIDYIQKKFKELIMENIDYIQKTFKDNKNNIVYVYYNPNVEQTIENSFYYNKNGKENLPYKEVKEWFEKLGISDEEADKLNIVRPAQYNLPFLVQNHFNMSIQPEDFNLEMWNYEMEVSISKWYY